MKLSDWEALDYKTKAKIEESLRRRGLDPDIMISRTKKDKLHIRWGLITFWLVYLVALGLFIWSLVE